jgi:rod shape-determining protein MreC
MVGNVFEVVNNTKEYLKLKDINEQLALENAQLRTQLVKKALKNDLSYNNSSDSTFINKYNFEVSKVINNSTDNFKNYLTINKGFADSLKPGMGVLCKDGIVGKVKSCSKYYSTITSVLNRDNLTSVKLKRTGTLGSMKWEGIDPTTTVLKYISRHIKIKKGDTIVTSELNAIYPEGEMVGVIKEIKVKGNESFYNIQVKLSTDFTSLSYVYVIKDKLKLQIDSLETASTSDKNETK